MSLCQPCRHDPATPEGRLCLLYRDERSGLLHEAHGSTGLWVVPAPLRPTAAPAGFKSHIARLNRNDDRAAGQVVGNNLVAGATETRQAGPIAVTAPRRVVGARRQVRAD